MFNQVNVIADDLAPVLAAYRSLGLDVPDAPEWPPGTGARHIGVAGPDGFQFDFDNTAMARLWAPEWPDPAGAVLGTSVPSSEAVDQAFAAAVAGGCRPVQSPYDAFFGARYAIVRDPAGNLVGLMGPRDRSRQYDPA